MSILHVENLSVSFETHSGPVTVVDRVSFRVRDGEILGIVGESGSGKSVMSLAIMGLLSSAATFRADYLNLDGEDLMKMSYDERRRFIAQKAAIIFQEPQNSLNPCFTIGNQLDEAIKFHGGGSRKERRIKALDLLNSVGIPDPEARLNCYPHQLSGGMNQRIVIAIALACEPKLLIADEPTTALDVTIQAQILDLLVNLNAIHKMGLMLITHDFALLAENTHRVGVMYSGQLMEIGRTENLLEHPHHPYTKALLESIPHLERRHQQGSRLNTLPGSIPPMDHLPVGCRLGPRCGYSDKPCVKQPELETIPGHGLVRCHFPLSNKTEDNQ